MVAIVMPYGPQMFAAHHEIDVGGETIIGMVAQEPAEEAPHVLSLESVSGSPGDWALRYEFWGRATGIKPVFRIQAAHAAGRGTEKSPC